MCPWSEYPSSLTGHHSAHKALIWSNEYIQLKPFRVEQNLSRLSSVDPHFLIHPRAMKDSTRSTHNQYPSSAIAFPRHCTTVPRRNIRQLHLLWSVIASPVSKSILKGHPEISSILAHCTPKHSLCTGLYLPALSHVDEHFPVNPWVAVDSQKPTESKKVLGHKYIHKCISQYPRIQHVFLALVCH